jgi:hypothetical protein
VVSQSHDGAAAKVRLSWGGIQVSSSVHGSGRCCASTIYLSSASNTHFTGKSIKSIGLPALDPCTLPLASDYDCPIRFNDDDDDAVCMVDKPL